MPIVVLGLSHRSAPTEVRNAHTFPAERVVEALGALRDYPAVREAAIVSTCNRIEIYADVTDFEVGAGQLKDFLTAYRHREVPEIDSYLYTLLGAHAVEQLFRVAGGLDSMLVGEAEVVAQVKQALRAAERAESIGANLHRLFRMALQTGKRARTETRIGRDAVSLGAAAVELASRHCDIRQAHALVVGAGKMGTIVAKHLHARAAKSIVIANRTANRAQALAAAVSGQAAALADILGLLPNVTLAVFATGGGEYLVTEAMLRTALGGEAHSGLLIFDIGVPRDAEPGASRIDGVTVYELADLREIVEEKLDERRSEIPAVEAIVADQLREYMHWYQSRAAAPLIAGLRRKAEEIRAAEIARLFARHPDLNEAQRASIDAASISIINRLLHAPVTRLRDTVAGGAFQLQQGSVAEVLDLASLGQQLERQLGPSLRPPLPRSR